MRNLATWTAAMVGVTAAASASDVLVDKGDMITDPEGGAGGAPISVVTGDYSSFGLGADYTGDSRMADVFWVDSEWEVDRIRVHLYSTGADPDDEPWESYEMQILDDNPGLASANVIDVSTEVENVEWTGVYRVSSGSPDSTARPIMQIEFVFEDLVLEPGWHWFTYGAEPKDGEATWANPRATQDPDTGDPVTIEGWGWRQSSAAGWRPMMRGDECIHDMSERRASAPFIVFGTAEAAECPEDLTGDGNVGGADLGTLLAAWGPCPDPDNCPEDLTGDGEVGGADLGTLLAAWGECPGETVEQPEPTGACCLEGDCSVLTAEECGELEQPDPFEPTYTRDFTLCEWEDGSTFCAVVPEADYQYDSGEVQGATTWSDRGIVGPAHRYHVEDGNNVIHNVATSFGSIGGTAGVEPGDPVGVALLEDDEGSPGEAIWWDNESYTADASAINTGELQIFDVPDVEVPDTFYVLVWVAAVPDEPGGSAHPAARNNDGLYGEACFETFQGGDAFLMGDSGNFDFDSYDPNDNQSLATLGDRVWVLRANQPVE